MLLQKEEGVDCKQMGKISLSRESRGLQGDQTSQSLKEISPDYSLEGLMLKLKFQYFGHLMHLTHWKRP